MPAHTVIWLHVVLAIDCDVKGTSVHCVSACTSPPSWETQSVDRKKEWLKWLIHIWFSYCTHTHTHTHACTLPWNQSVSHAFGCFGSSQHSSVPGDSWLWHGWEFNSLPWSVTQSLPRLAVRFLLLCLLETCYHHGIQSTCKWAKAENTLTSESLASHVLNSHWSIEHLSTSSLSATQGECMCVRSCAM